MSLVQRTDYVQAALARLPRQFMNKPRLAGIISAFAEEAQEVEAGLFTLREPRFLANAAGAMLDIYGALVGQARGALSDASYRIWIRARMAVNRSNGTGNDLLRIARLLVAPTNTLLLREPYPAAVTIQVAGGATAFSDDIYQLLRTAKMGGVSFRFTTQDGADAERFVFEGGVGLGWGGHPVDWVGPVLASSPYGAGPGLGPVVELVNQNGSAPPVVTLSGYPLPTDVGTITLNVISATDFTWTSTGGYGSSGQGINPGNVPVDLEDENVIADFIGVLVEWNDGDPYMAGDSWQFDTTVPTLSTAPVVTTTGPVTASGRITFHVTTGTPAYWFRYRRPDGTFSATQTMNRGVAIPMRNVNNSLMGVSVTWPLVTTYYTGAQHTVRVHAANATVGGRWVSVR